MLFEHRGGAGARDSVLKEHPTSRRPGLSYTLWERRSPRSQMAWRRSSAPRRQTVRHRSGPPRSCGRRPRWFSPPSCRHSAEADSGPRPPGWRLSPRAVRSFLCGSKAPEVPPQVLRRRLPWSSAPSSASSSNRGLMLVGEPGTAKSMLSELLAAAISGTSIDRDPGHRRHDRGPHQVFVELCTAAGRGAVAAGARRLAALPGDARRPDRPVRGDHPLPARDPGYARQHPLREGHDRPRAGRARPHAARPARLQRDRHREYPRPRRARDVQRTEAPVQLRDRAPDPRAEAGDRAGRARVRPAAPGGRP